MVPAPFVGNRGTGRLWGGETTISFLIMHQIISRKMLKTLLGGVNAVWRGEAAVYDRTGTKLSSLRCTDCRHVPGGSRCRKQWITSTNGASARRRYARRPKALLRDRQERRCWTLLRPMNEW